MNKIHLTPRDRQKYSLLMTELSQFTVVNGEAHAKKMKNRVLGEFLASPEHSVDLKRHVCSVHHYLRSAQLWGYENFTAPYLKRLLKVRRINNVTVPAAARNKNFTWEMAEFLIQLAENGDVAPKNLNLLLQKLNTDVWTEEFIQQFNIFINGRNQIMLKSSSGVSESLNLRVVYDHARRVFGLEGYPDEWVQQVVLNSVPE